MYLSCRKVESRVNKVKMKELLIRNDLSNVCFPEIVHWKKCCKFKLLFRYPKGAHLFQCFLPDYGLYLE